MKELNNIPYIEWDKHFHKAFELAQKSGESILIRGDSFLNPFRDYKVKSSNPFVTVKHLYYYEGKLFSIVPNSSDVDYGGYGDHSVTMVDIPMGSFYTLHTVL